jgi:hypothetical protein
MLTQNPNAISLLKENIDKIDWHYICGNPNAIDIIRNNLDKIDWNLLSGNPNAIQLLKENPDKIDWNLLSGNPNAIELLEENKNKINWEIISENPSIFTYDYDLIKNNFKELGEDIIIKALHPKRLLKLMELYGEDEIYFCYFDE